MELLSLRGDALYRAPARWLLFAFSAWLPLLAAPSADAQSPVESGVKATYLYKFVPFIEWPPGTFASPADPLALCVAGTDAVAQLIDEAVKGQVISGHAIEVRHLAGGVGDTRCHILYVALRGPAAVALLDSVRGAPVLTITDAARDPRIQGVVNFVVQENRVRFEIDLRAATENHLVVSSKLLNLAIHVSPKPGF